MFGADNPHKRPNSPQQSVVVPKDFFSANAPNNSLIYPIARQSRHNVCQNFQVKSGVNLDELKSSFSATISPPKPALGIMRNNPEIKLVTGILIWIGLIALTAISVRHTNAISPRAVQDLIGYIGAQRSSINIISPQHVVLGIGDPLFVEKDGVLEPIGMVTALKLDQSQLDLEKRTKTIRLAWVKGAQVTFFTGGPSLGEGASIELNATDQSPAWIVKTMLSPSMRKEISQLISAAYSDHQEDLVEQFRPVIKKTIVDSAQLVRDSVLDELNRQQETVAAISHRYQNDVIQKELMPVIQAEVWPIVEEEASPLVEEIGQEVWQEVSVWRFGWRFLYDKSPLPDKKLSQREFDRFVQNKALPIFESHFEDVIEMQKRMIARVLANKKVTETVSTVAREFFSDEEVQRLFKDVFRKAVVDNPELRESIERTWQSEEARSAMKMANGRLESTITRIGQSLFGSPKGKITPEFARVLRNRVLHKDDRWLVLTPGNSVEPSASSEPLRALELTIATKQKEFPIGIDADQSETISVETRGDDE